MRTETILCVSKYADYNSGRGGWIDIQLPMEEEKLNEIMECFGDDETFISDGWDEKNDFCFMEDDDVFFINDVITKIENLTEYEYKKMIAILESEDRSDMKYINYVIENLETIVFYEDMKLDELAEQIVDEMGLPGWAKCYFDYDSFVKDLETEYEETAFGVLQLER